MRRSARQLPDVAPVGAEAYFGEDGDAELGDVFHLVLDEGAEFVGEDAFEPEERLGDHAKFVRHSVDLGFAKRNDILTAKARKRESGS